MTSTCFCVVVAGCTADNTKLIRHHSARAHRVTDASFLTTILLTWRTRACIMYTCFVPDDDDDNADAIERPVAKDPQRSA